jgi:transcriptional regulator GlxA family with amidase domain
VRAAVRCILRTHGSVQIDALAAALGMNARGLQRRFEGWVGLTPKTLARLARFQHVFHALQLGDDAWAGIAVRCGYYDQSHLLRDFRDFAGESPAALLSRELPITHAFTRARRVSDSSYL